MEPTQPDDPTQPYLPAIGPNGQEANQPPTPNVTDLSARGMSTDRRNLIVGISAFIGICLFCSLCGLLAKAASGGSSSTPSGNVVVAKATATVTTKPVALIATATATATKPANPNDPARVASYIGIVTGDATALSSDLSSAGTDCSAAANDPSQISVCRSDMVSIQADTQAFQNDLDDNPAPPCLASADANLRKALPLLNQGAQDGIDGIDQNDGSKLTAGGALFRQATTYVDQATAAINHAQCA